MWEYVPGFQIVRWSDYLFFYFDGSAESFSKRPSISTGYDGGDPCTFPADDMKWVAELVWGLGHDAHH